ncbi:MAG: response regulator, partial [Calditrichaeota bacterium]|nr:response regulator [Calditrichota bacterium]
VVDDEIDLLKTIVEVLKLKFDRVDMATSGKEALDKIGECDYDVVLTDLGMPEMSGWEVAEKVKGLLPASKVILVTGWGMHAEDELINHEAYVDTILSKPYDLHQLLMIIEQVFSDDQGASVGD